MNDFTATQCCLFGEFFTRPVLMQFDQTQGTSDGGAMLLRAANQRYGAGLIEALTASVVDRRQAGKVEHSVVELMHQRVYGLACGYEDANDAARIGADPMHKLLGVAIRTRVSIWPRSRRCRALRTPLARKSSTAWAWRWPRA